MQRAGFDAFEVKKDADAVAFAETLKRYSVFYQPTGDGRVTVLKQRLARMNDNGELMKGSCGIPDDRNSDRAIVRSCCGRHARCPPELDRVLQDASPVEIIRAAVRRWGATSWRWCRRSARSWPCCLNSPPMPIPPSRSCFSTPAGCSRKRSPIATRRRTCWACAMCAASSPRTALARDDGDRELWLTDPDACCRIRKVEPLARALRRSMVGSTAASASKAATVPTLQWSKPTASS